jgi:SPP1 family phage portal protein
LNKAQIDYLYRYYKGEQPILNRKKLVRKDICNKIIENRANEIVSFKVGYLCGEPIQYIGRNSDENPKISEDIRTLNDYMFTENKAMKDKQIVEWQMISGTSYRVVLPKISLKSLSFKDSPFEVNTLDPRNTFIVYSTEIGEKPLMGVTCWLNDKNGFEEKGIFTISPNTISPYNFIYSIYTDKEYFEITNDQITKNEFHALGGIPIIEYPANDSRLGSFEIVISMLDAINTIESNRVDSIEQTVQAIWKFVNCNVDDELYDLMMAKGAVMVKSVDGQKADLDVVKNELNQAQIQSFIDYLYQSILTICGIPNRNGGTSTSDTGQAVHLRDGWSSAEANAKSSELMFKGSERNFLKIVLGICKNSDKNFDLKLNDVEQKFTRRNYENIQSKAQVLTEMLKQEKIHPLLAFTHCGMFSDPEEAYAISKKYYEEVLNKIEEESLKKNEYI